MDSETQPPEGGPRPGTRPGPGGPHPAPGGVGGPGLVEVERKFDVGPGFVMPGLSGLPGVAGAGPPRVHHLSAVYLDTADRRLAAAKITLRRRTGGGDAGWHLKLPVGADTRREEHAPLGDGTEPVPGRLTALVDRWTRGAAVRPIARLDTTRTLTILTGQGGRALAEVADDAVTGSLPPAGAPWPPGARAGGGGVPWHELPHWQVVARWREVEAELREGSPDLLDAIGDRLRRAGAVPATAASKLARLLAAARPPAGQSS